jgi:acetyl-CoA synthetase
MLSFPPSYYSRKPTYNKEEFSRLYKDSIEKPSEFWAKMADSLDWFKEFDEVSNNSFAKENLSIEWFKGGKLNVSYNCIDRHLPKKANQPALIWEGDNPNNSKTITYQELHDEVCRFANILNDLGVKKGDRVVIYLPMILESAFAMLACSRIGAIHSVVFAGFSPEALRGRIEDLQAKFLITANYSYRGGKKINLKENVDAAIKLLSPNPIKKTIVVDNGEVAKIGKNEVSYNQLRSKASTNFTPVAMDAEDPLFILYTSGSTGKPKGVLHSTAGYLLYASLTHKIAFAIKEGEVFFCTADVGWITGHSYVVYAPLCNGITSVIFEGIPTYPDYSRYWQIVDKYGVDVFYTAPTALRSLMKMGESWVNKASLKSLKVLGSVGEPINPEVWLWYHKNVGKEKCPIIDTWWQTETGGFVITPIAGISTLKPGFAGKPFLGIKAGLVNSKNQEFKGEGVGNLCIDNSWPGQARTLYNNHAKFYDTYFSTYANKFFSGDGARRDADGDYQITGRVDDIIKVSGHKIGTAEVESALVLDHRVAESAVVGFPHEIKGQGIFAFVILKNGVEVVEAIKQDLINLVAKEISPIAKPDKIIFTPDLPKTRSGKIMRRILRKIAEGERKDFGDIRTLNNPEIVNLLLGIVNNKS